MMVGKPWIWYFCASPVLVLVQVHGEERDVVLLKHLRGLGPLRLRLLAVTAPRGVKENAREVSATDLVVEVVNGELERLKCVVATLLLRLHDARRERQRQTKQNQQILDGVHGRRSPHVFSVASNTKQKKQKREREMLKKKRKTSSNAESP